MCLCVRFILLLCKLLCCKYNTRRSTYSTGYMCMYSSTTTSSQKFVGPRHCVSCCAVSRPGGAARRWQHNGQCTFPPTDNDKHPDRTDRTSASFSISRPRSTRFAASRPRPHRPTRASSIRGEAQTSCPCRHEIFSAPHPSTWW